MKRSVEKEQEDPAPSTCKQKRRRLKHSLIEGGWGELNPQTREPATVEKEQQDPCYMEPTSTNIELSWSKPPLEQSLKQTKLTGFLPTRTSSKNQGILWPKMTMNLLII